MSVSRGRAHDHAGGVCPELPVSNPKVRKLLKDVPRSVEVYEESVDELM